MGSCQSDGCELYRYVGNKLLKSPFFGKGQWRSWALIVGMGGILSGCLSGPEPVYRQVTWEDIQRQRTNYILWEKCQNKKDCPFLEEYGPNEFVRPNLFKLSSETCYGDECDELKEFGPKEEHFYNQKNPK